MNMFWAMCKKPHGFSAKNVPLFFCAFLLFSTRLLWFRAKSAFLIFGEIIVLFADFAFVFAKCSL